MIRFATKILILSSLLISLTAAVPGNKKAGKDILPPGVELSCMLVSNDKPLTDYTIIVCCNECQADTIHVKDIEDVYFRLEYGRQYAIIHRAAGFRERIVMMNTQVDQKTSLKKKVFDYEIEMISVQQPANTLYDLPVAVVRYDPSTGKFDYSRKYHQQVRN